MESKIKSKYGTKSVSLPKSLMKKLLAIGKKENKTFSAVLKDAVVIYLESRKDTII